MSSFQTEPSSRKSLSCRSQCELVLPTKMCGGLAALALAFGSGSAVAQGQSACPYDWAPTPGVTGFPRAFSMLTTDEGTYLYMVGKFSAVGSLPALSVARWDGEDWQAMGSGIADDLRAVVTHEVNGEKVVITAAQRAMWWDGASWQKLGSTDELFAYAMIEHDWDAGGPMPPELFAGGNNKLARFNGTEWEKFLGGNVKRALAGGIIYALASYDDAAGPKLIAGGYFDTIGTIPLLNIASWDGQSWSPLAEGLGKATGTLPGYVSALRTFDEDGPGPKPPVLFAGGDFTVSGSGKPLAAIARWDGVEWSEVGGGLTSNVPINYAGVWEFATLPTPSGEWLIAGGTWHHAGNASANSIAGWNGSKWLALAEGITPVSGQGSGVIGVGYFQGNHGPELFGGGIFASSGLIPAKGLARWAPCGVSCFADADGDGQLDVDDFIHFQTQYATANPGADCTQDGTLSIDDFLCFQTAFSLGC